MGLLPPVVIGTQLPFIRSVDFGGFADLPVEKHFMRQISPTAPEIVKKGRSDTQSLVPIIGILERFTYSVMVQIDPRFSYFKNRHSSLQTTGLLLLPTEMASATVNQLKSWPVLNQWS